MLLPHIKDVDLFPVGLSREHLLQELARIGRVLHRVWHQQHKAIHVFRTRNCITFRCQQPATDAFQWPIIQVILRNHASLAHVLYGFDLVRGEHSPACALKALASMLVSPFHPLRSGGTSGTTSGTPQVHLRYTSGTPQVHLR